MSPERREANSRIIPRVVCKEVCEKLPLTFSIGARDIELLDLRSPWHGREQLEGILAVDLGAVDVEIYEAVQHRE